MTDRHDDDDELLTRAEVARWLKVSTRTVDRWADAGTLTRLKTTTGLVRFRRGEVAPFARGVAA